MTSSYMMDSTASLVRHEPEKHRAVVEVERKVESVERGREDRHRARHQQPLLQQRLRVHLANLAERAPDHAEDVGDGFVHEVSRVELVLPPFFRFEVVDVALQHEVGDASGGAERGAEAVGEAVPEGAVRCESRAVQRGGLEQRLLQLGVLRGGGVFAEVSVGMPDEVWAGASSVAAARTVFCRWERPDVDGSGPRASGGRDEPRPRARAAAAPALSAFFDARAVAEGTAGRGTRAAGDAARKRAPTEATEPTG